MSILEPTADALPRGRLKTKAANHGRKIWVPRLARFAVASNLVILRYLNLTIERE